MISGDFTSDGLIVKGRITKLEMMYEPAYWFWGKYTANWSATFVFVRHEEYLAVEDEPYYIDGKKYTRQKQVMKTRRVEDPRPMSGVISGNYSFFGYAGNSNNGHVIELVEGATSSGDTEFSPDFLATVSARQFTASEERVFNDRLKEPLNDQIETEIIELRKGDHQRDWNWSTNINKADSCSLLVPIGHAQFEYRGSTYNLWTDGRNVRRQSHDNLPVDWERSNTAATINENVSASTKRAYFPWASLLQRLHWMPNYPFPIPRGFERRFYRRLYRI